MKEAGRTYHDGTVFIHIPSSSLYIKSARQNSKKEASWIENLEIYDKNVNSGNISEYEDPIAGNERPVKITRR